MSDQEQLFRAKIARLQVDIDQRRKDLDQTQPSSATKPVEGYISSQIVNAGPNLSMPSHNATYRGPNQSVRGRGRGGFQSFRSAPPAVTKMVWHLHPPSAAPQPIKFAGNHRGSMKLIRPKPAPHILSLTTKLGQQPKTENTAESGKTSGLRATSDAFIPKSSLLTSSSTASGTTYFRTKGGNLISLSALRKNQARKENELAKARIAQAACAKPQFAGPTNHHKWDLSDRIKRSQTSSFARSSVVKKDEQCLFFAKNGVCRSKNGRRCPYQHDPTKVAVCRRFLGNKCPNTSASCLLSHMPSPHNMENCSHYPRCNKPDCPYSHVKVTSSQICHDFATFGWCSKGIECAERHVRECPAKGTCSNPGCRLNHVISRSTNEVDGDDDVQSSKVDDSEEHEHGSHDLFFTDLKGKRKAETGMETIPSGPDHHCGLADSSPVGRKKNRALPSHKRRKHDQMAQNEDFVMFVSSDHESEEDEDNGDDEDNEDNEDNEDDEDDEESEEEGEGKDDLQPSDQDVSANEDEAVERLLLGTRTPCPVRQR